MKFSHLLLLALCFPAASCQGPYNLIFNERVVYSPNPNPAANLLADPNLQGCLNQILIGSGSEDPAAVNLMACPSQGIQSLQGIGNLRELEQLDLSGNSISELGPLSSLEDLRVLSLHNNQIRSVSPLMDLPQLRFVSLQGNDAIPCRQLDRLEEKLVSLQRPLDCRR